MNEPTRRTALSACLALGMADLLAMNTLVLPDLRHRRSPSIAAAAPPSPAVKVDVEIAPRVVPRPALEGEVQSIEPVLVFFGTNVHQLDRQARAIVDRVASQLAQGKETILVDGHADLRGGARYNERLSRQRALAVARRLRAGGVSGLQVRAFGARRPVSSGADPRSLQRNRRVEIAVLREGT